MKSPSLPQSDNMQGAWREQFVHVNGINLHTLRAGPADAPLVLLLHGFPEFAYSWRYQLTGLSDRYHLVAPDLRGYNLSDKPRHGYDIATLCNDVRGLIEAFGEREATIVGHDWGGGIAWAFAIRDPDYTRRLAILNAPHPAAMLRELRNPRQISRSSYIAFFQFRGLAERAIARDDYAIIRRTFRSADRGRAWLSDADIQRYVDAIACPGALSAALEYYRQLPRDFQHISPTRVITAPTLVLWGELDPYLGPELVDDLDLWVRDLQIRRFPTAGHWLNQQEPERVNAALRTFLHSPPHRHSPRLTAPLPHAEER
ncbi:MAG: alpha/beta fold hydrolase [Ktedonobacterales bacterium]